VSVRSVLKVSLLLLASAAILGVVVAAVGVEKTANAVAEAGVVAFAAVGALTAVSLTFQSLAWMALNRPIGHRVPFRTLLQGVVAGVAGNILTPSTYLGGEPLKVVYVGRRTGLPYHELAGTVVLSKYIELISFILFFGFCTAVATVRFSAVLFDPPYTVAGVSLLVLAGGLLTFGLVMWLSLSRRWRPLTRLLKCLARVRPLRRRLVRLWRWTRQMEDQVSRVFCEEGLVSLAAFGAFVVAHAAILAKPVTFFYLGSRLHLDLGQLCLLFAASQGLLAVQLTPSGAGTLDGGLIGTFALMGLDGADHIAQCMAFLLCLRLWDLAIVGAGALLGARVGAGLLSAKAPAHAADASTEGSDDAAQPPPDPA